MHSWKNSPYVTITIVALNMFIFVLCLFTGDFFYRMGELGVWRVCMQKEYGRIFSAMFLHADVKHLFNNMLILFLMGSLLEKEIGHTRFAFAYFTSGLVGNVVSLGYKMMSRSLIPSVGASGAVFGLDGILLALVLFSERHMENATPIRVMLMVGLSLYSGFTSPFVDNACHVGGLATGFVIGYVICIIDRIKKNSNGR